MTISVGDTIPAMDLGVLGDNGPEALSTDEIFKDRKVVVFGLPGAFTPVCSAQHLPGYIANAEAIKAKGVDTIACISVNDPWVMTAWGKEQGAGDKVLMLGDGNGEFAKGTGLDVDLSAKFYNVRIQRFSMIVEDGVVTSFNLEEPGAFRASNAEKILEQL